MAKKILEEGTVRRFMKIAGLQPLSESFVDNLEEVSHEDEMEEGYGKDKKPMQEEAEEEPEMDDTEPEGEEEVEVDMSDEGMMSEDEKVDLLQKLAQALGVDVEVEADEEPEMGPEEPEMGPEEPEMDDAGLEGEEDVMEEGEHMEEPAKDPAGHSLESLPLVRDADSRDPNQSPKTKEQDPTKAPGSKHMAESREAFKNRIVEQVAKRVAQRLKNLK